MNAEKTGPCPTTVGLLAGLWGGVAEIVWVGAYSSAAGTSALAVAREVAVAVAPSTAGLTAAPLLGLALHMLLAAAIGMVFGFAYGLVSRGLRPIPTMLAAVATLLVIWAVNFFALLPVLHPPFVTLMPLAATLVSKLLFGVTMGWIIQAYTIAPPTVAAEHLSLSLLQERNAA